MNKQLLALLAIALAPVCAFAVDGVTLINESTVMAAGGFPYQITSVGSYQLSGNLVATSGKQAILVAANNVVLDLNGFNVSCSLGYSAGKQFSNCVGDSGFSGVTDVSIRNGTVTLTQTQGAPVEFLSTNIAVGFLFSTNLIIEELHIVAINNAAMNQFAPAALEFGANSIVRHNIVTAISGPTAVGASSGGGFFGSCPSLIEGSVNTPGGGLFWGTWVV